MKSCWWLIGFIFWGELDHFSASGQNALFIIVRLSIVLIEGDWVRIWFFSLGWNIQMQNFLLALNLQKVIEIQLTAQKLWHCD